MSEEIFFNFGDLVRVDGYWPRVFKVDGYRREQWLYPDEEWTDVVYELHDVGNFGIYRGGHGGFDTSGNFG